MLKYSIPLVFTGFFFLIIRWINTFILGYFENASAVGLYNVSLSTADLMYVIPIALTTLSFPIMTEMYSKNKNLKSIYNTTTKWIFLITLPMFLFFIFFSRDILRIMFGNEYGNAALALSILAGGYIIYSLAKTAMDVLSIVKKTKIIFYVTSIAAIVNIILSLILIPKFHLIGAAISTSVAFMIMGIIFFYYAYKINKLQPIKLFYIKTIIIGLVSIFIIYKLSNMMVLSIYKLFLILLLFVWIYLFLLYIFKILDYEDKLVIQSWFKKIKFI